MLTPMVSRHVVVVRLGVMSGQEGERFVKSI